MVFVLMMSFNLLHVHSHAFTRSRVHAFTLRTILADSALEELGKGVNLRKTNLLHDFQELQASLFESLSPSCFIKNGFMIQAVPLTITQTLKPFIQK